MHFQTVAVASAIGKQLESNKRIDEYHLGPQLRHLIQCKEREGKRENSILYITSKKDVLRWRSSV